MHVVNIKNIALDESGIESVNYIIGLMLNFCKKTDNNVVHWRGNMLMSLRCLHLYVADLPEIDDCFMDWLVCIIIEVGRISSADSLETKESLLVRIITEIKNFKKKLEITFSNQLYA